MEQIIWWYGKSNNANNIDKSIQQSFDNYYQSVMTGDRNRKLQQNSNAGLVATALLWHVAEALHLPGLHKEQ